MKPACRARRPSEPASGLEQTYENEDNVIGQISGKVKGGFTVNIDGIRAFLPGSLVDVRPVRDPAYLEGKDLEFKIIKLDRRRNNLVVSRRAVVEHEYAAEREDLIDRLTEGAVVKGVVKSLLRCIPRPGWHRWSAAHHRHGLEACAPSFRGRGRRR